MTNLLRTNILASHDPNLVDELLEAYTEIKRNFYLGGLRLAEVEGGRFCEAAFRLLQERVTGSYTPLGKMLNTDSVILSLANVSSSLQPESVRIHIPRVLRVVYDIRNKRDAAHLADNIDPNLQDASLVVGAADWVMAEFVRLHHAVTVEEAQAIVDGLVTRGVPVVQDFEGFLKVLNPKMRPSHHLLVLIYQRGGVGATLTELTQWSRPSMRTNLRRTLSKLEHDEAFAHFNGERYFITLLGVKEVEKRRLLEMP